MRTVTATYGRWRVTRQGTPVAPELEEEPWWEQEPEPAKKKARKKRSKRSKARKKAKPRPTDGTLPPLDLLDRVSPIRNQQAPTSLTAEYPQGRPLDKVLVQAHPRGWLDLDNDASAILKKKEHIWIVAVLFFVSLVGYGKGLFLVNENTIKFFQHL